MRWSLVAGAAWLALAASAFAQGTAGSDDLEPSADTRLEAVREMVLYARYAEAETAVDELLARTDMTPTQRNQALEIKAIILLARRQTSRADAVLRELYGRDPEHRIVDRDAGPSVRAAFERARDLGPPAANVRLESDAVPSLDLRQSPPITVRIAEGADVVHELRLSYRNGASGPFERVIMRLDETRTMGRTRVPLAEGRDAYVLHYFVEALAPSQVVVAALGSSDEAIALDIPAEAAPTLAIQAGTGDASSRDTVAGGSVLEEWWFWTVIGVLVAGGAATVGALYGTHVIGPPAGGSLGEGRF